MKGFDSLDPAQSSLVMAPQGSSPERTHVTDVKICLSSYSSLPGNSETPTDLTIPVTVIIADGAILVEL